MANTHFVHGTIGRVTYGRHFGFPHHGWHSGLHWRTFGVRRLSFFCFHIPPPGILANDIEHSTGRDGNCPWMHGWHFGLHYSVFAGQGGDLGIWEFRVF